MARGNMKPIPTRLDDLGPDGIELVLALSPADRGEEIGRAVADFLERIGGLENARRATAMLRGLERAALQ